MMTRREELEAARTLAADAKRHLVGQEWRVSGVEATVNIARQHLSDAIRLIDSAIGVEKVWEDKHWG